MAAVEIGKDETGARRVRKEVGLGKGELTDGLLYLEPLSSSIKPVCPQKVICSHRSESIDLPFFSCEYTVGSNTIQLLLLHN